jgi:uncharacterized protein
MERSISVGFVSLFYLVVTVVAVVVGRYVADIDVLVWHNDHRTSVIFDTALGAGVGVVVVILSQILDRTTEWAKRLTSEFTKILGHLRPWQVLVFALWSGIAEEIFFRGFLQQVLTVKVLSFEGGAIAAVVVTSLIFGGLHLGPDFRKFWPWTAMAAVLGLVFGAMYLYTGNVVAPIVAHFTINFFNLYFMTQSSATAEQDRGDDP